MVGQVAKGNAFCGEVLVCDATLKFWGLQETTNSQLGFIGT